MKPAVSKKNPRRKALCLMCSVALAAALVPFSSIPPAYGDEAEGGLLQTMQEYAQKEKEACRMAAESDNPAYALSLNLQQYLNSDAANPEGATAAQANSSRSAFPSKYFLTNEGTVTDVKIQNPWGTCWAFSNISAIESSVLKASGAASGSGVADSPKLDNLPTAPDFSEHALAWYGLTFQDDISAPSQAGEGVQVSGERVGERQMGLGGPAMLAPTSLMARQLLTSEDSIPYTYRDADGSFHTSDDSWWMPVENSQTGGWDQPFFNDWSLDTNVSRSFSDTGWQVKNVAMLPSPANIQLNEEGKPAEYIYNEGATQAIKERLQSTGAVSIMYAADMSMPTVPPSFDASENGRASGADSEAEAASSTAEQNGPEPSGATDETAEPESDSTDPAENTATHKKTGAGEYMNYGENSEMWCQYNNSLSPKINHVVNIVGWDDNYNAENFAGAAAGWEKPPANGAWLVKNSWGADDFFTSDYHGRYNITQWGLKSDESNPDSSSGFFWLSYYDHSIAGLASYEVERTSEGPENLYQYDYLGLSVTASPAGEASPEPTKIANIFTAEGNEILSAVSAQTPVQNAEVNAKVYLLDETSTKPEDGKLVAEKTVTPEFAGIYRIDLDNPVRMKAGQKFAVVETVLGAYQGKNRISYANLEVSNKLTEYLINAKSEAKYNDSESFAYDEGRWQSIEEINKQLESKPNMQAFKFGNALIKAYTDPDPNPLANTSFVDDATGVSVEGYMDSASKLSVSKGKLHEESDEGCDAIRKASRAGHVLSLHDVTLSGEHQGSIAVSLPVKDFDGNTLTVVHCADGKLEPLDATVESGKVTVRTESLSPFAVLDGVYTAEQIAAMGVSEPVHKADPNQGNIGGNVGGRLADTGDDMPVAVATLAATAVAALLAVCASAVVRVRRR